MSNYQLVEQLYRLYKTAEQESQRLAILQALGRMGVWATTRLEQALYDACPAVRAEAAKLLGDIPDWGSTNHLLRMLQHDSAPICRATAAVALGKLFQPFVPEIPPLNHDGYWAGYFKKEVPAQLVRALLTDESYRVRAAAARGLAHLGNKENAKHLAVALKDEDHEVRAAAALALGTLKVFPYIGEVGRLMHDPHPEVRRAAQEAVQALESY